MKVGDDVRVANNPDAGVGKIIRFYANQGTVLVEFAKTSALAYCDYSALVKSETGT